MFLGLQKVSFGQILSKSQWVMSSKMLTFDYVRRGNSCEQQQQRLQKMGLEKRNCRGIWENGRAQRTLAYREAALGRQVQHPLNARGLSSSGNM